MSSLVFFDGTVMPRETKEILDLSLWFSCLVKGDMFEEFGGIKQMILKKGLSFNN
jgi:hypothetical protein